VASEYLNARLGSSRGVLAYTRGPPQFRRGIFAENHPKRSSARRQSCRGPAAAKTCTGSQFGRSACGGRAAPAEGRQIVALQGTQVMGPRWETCPSPMRTREANGDGSGNAAETTSERIRETGGFGCRRAPMRVVERRYAPRSLAQASERRLHARGVWALQAPSWDIP